MALGGAAGIQDLAILDRHGVEQADLVADAGHQRDTGAVQDIHHPFGEGFRAGLVEHWISHDNLPTNLSPHIDPWSWLLCQSG